MLACHRCGIETARLTVDQTHCPRCTVEVRELIASDTARRSRVVWRPGDVTPYSGRRAA